MKKLSYDTARDYFSYDPITGDLRWRISKCGVLMGALAGSKPYWNRSSKVRVNGDRYRVADVCWLLHYKVWPEGRVVYKNKVGNDNRAKNLELFTDLSGSGAVPKSGHRYVYWVDAVSKWCVSVKWGGKKVYVGVYDTVQQAVEARDNFIRSME